jgi:cob(I)alamin adenosyltransferase
VDLIGQGLEQTAELLQNGEYDLMILDEINCALFFELVDWSTVESLLDGRPDKTEMVLTGRGAPQALIDKADLVTEMREIKHYFTRGVMARKGIEN